MSTPKIIQHALSRPPYYAEDGLYDFSVLRSLEENGSYRARRKGRCVEFDGVNDNGNAVSSVIGATNELTITFWAKYGATTGYIVAERTLADAAFSCSLYQGSMLCVVSSAADLSNYKSLRNNQLTNDNEWHHFTFVFSDSVLSSFIDGIANTDITLLRNDAMTMIHDSTAALNIGKYASGTLYFLGSLRDLRIYSVRKTEAQIQSIMDCNGSNPDLVGCVGKWTMNEENGITAYDTSGNENHITWSNITQSTFHAVDDEITTNPANQVGYSDGEAGAIIPAIDATTDALGNNLTYKGKAPLPIVTEVPCVTNDTCYITATLAGTETVVSWTGSTTTPTISANRIDWDSGESLASLVLSNGTSYTFQEGAGRTVYDTAGSNHGTIIGGDITTIWANKVVGKDHCVEHGGGVGASDGEFIPGVPDSSLCVDGSPKTIQPGHTSPFTLMNRDPFNVPELVGLGCDTPFESTDKEHLIAPLSTKFATNKNGSKTRLLTYDTSIDEHPNYPFIGARKAKGTTMRTIKSGTTQPFARIELSDSIGPVTDVSHNTPGLSIKYKIGNAAAVTLTPVAMTASNYTSGGIYHAGNGTYMIGLPTALVTAASHDPISVWVELADVDSSRDEVQVVAYDATQVAVGANTTTPPTTASIATAVWANTTRTLSAISDSAGITTLLMRITGLLRTKTQDDAVDEEIKTAATKPQPITTRR